MQPDEELHTAVSLEAKYEPSPNTEKVFLIHSLHSGKLPAHDTREQLPYILSTPWAQDKLFNQKLSKEASKQKNMGRHMYIFLTDIKQNVKWKRFFVTGGQTKREYFMKLKEKAAASRDCIMGGDEGTGRTSAPTGAKEISNFCQQLQCLHLIL